jgi:hypothetical protein
MPNSGQTTRVTAVTATLAPAARKLTRLGSRAPQAAQQAAHALQEPRLGGPQGDGAVAVRSGDEIDTWHASSMTQLAEAQLSLDPPIRAAPR